jgi:hypothetical protein
VLGDLKDRVFTNHLWDTKKIKVNNIFHIDWAPQHFLIGKH